MKKFLSSLLLALTVIVTAAPARAYNRCNLFDSYYLLQANGWTENDGEFSGNIGSLFTKWFTNGTIPVNSEPDTRYTLSYDIKMNDTAYGGRFRIMYSDGTYTDCYTYQSVDKPNYVHVTQVTPADKTVTGIKFAYTGGNGQVYLKNVQLEKGSTATSYVPYNPLCATCQGIVKNYESAVGTVVQNGTPTPTNPVEPTFYQQGDMILRKVGDYADSYDATTGKITRRVGVKVLNGTEEWGAVNAGAGRYFLHRAFGLYDYGAGAFVDIMCNTFRPNSGAATTSTLGIAFYKNSVNEEIPQLRITYPEITTIDDFKSYLAQQYSAGTPVTVYYPLATLVEETVTSTTYCADTIKIATTAYNSARFSPVVTDLNSAVATIREIVTKTINQTAAIASLQADKQTRPEEQCPAGKKCLLVETEENGVIVPHWFPIIEAPENTE